MIFQHTPFLFDFCFSVKSLVEYVVYGRKRLVSPYQPYRNTDDGVSPRTTWNSSFPQKALVQPVET